jgi:hypothetical protein
MLSNLKTFGYYLLEKETKAKIFIAILYVLGVFGALENRSGKTGQ